MALEERLRNILALPGAPLRLKATAIHFLVSLFVVVLAAAVVFLLWFPRGLAELLRGGGLFWLLIACDATLGPVMSFVVCSPGKSRRMLVFDYTVIAAIQLAALVYGLSVAAASRPVYMVFSVDRFDLVSAFEVQADDPRDLQALRDFPLPWFGPRTVTLKLPEDTPGRNEALSLELEGGELHTHPRYFVPYAAGAALAKAEPLQSLLAKFPLQRPEVEAALRSADLSDEAVVWLPARSRFGFHTALLRRSDAEIVTFLPGDPY